MRPIAIEYLIRRLEGKCANRRVISKKKESLSPFQLRVVVPRGTEAAVHATIRLLSQMPSDRAVVNLDFTNAFNSVRRDAVLDATAKHTITLLFRARNSCEPILAFGEHQILSKEGLGISRSGVQ